MHTDFSVCQNGYLSYQTGHLQGKMIKAGDLYNVLSALVPLYVAMIVGYGSVKWWKILTPEQCGGINRFVSFIAIPLLSFKFIAKNNPYEMNSKFIAADVISKVAILVLLSLWVGYSRVGSLDWLITIFVVATLPNTLVIGVPLLEAIYGNNAAGLAVQALVMQSIVWYTFLLFVYEFRAAKILVLDQFSKTAASNVSFKVDSDLPSVDRSEPEPIICDDGKLRVHVRKSSSSLQDLCLDHLHPSLKSQGLLSMPSSKALRPRSSDFIGTENCSSVNFTSSDWSFNHNDVSMSFCKANSPRQPNIRSGDVYSLHSPGKPTAMTSTSNEDSSKDPCAKSTCPDVLEPKASANLENEVAKGTDVILRISGASETGLKVFEENAFAAEETTKNYPGPKDLQLLMRPEFGAAGNQNADLGSEVPRQSCDQRGQEDFTLKSNNSKCLDKYKIPSKNPSHFKMSHSSSSKASPKLIFDRKSSEMLSSTVMSGRIADMVARKLIRNPSTYACLLGLGWALVSFRWHLEIPKLIDNSIGILLNAGLGMAMFSLGLSMATQKRIISCGPSIAAASMAIRFIVGPAAMTAASIVVGLKGSLLRAAIIQAALPQAIVPCVYAKDYNLHPDILSTSLLFSLLLSFPITLVYYIILGL